MIATNSQLRGVIPIEKLTQSQIKEFLKTLPGIAGIPIHERHQCSPPYRARQSAWRYHILLRPEEFEHVASSTRLQTCNPASIQLLI